jgi:hypothetical protein
MPGEFAGMHPTKGGIVSLKAYDYVCTPKEIAEAAETAVKK